MKRKKHFFGVLISVLLSVFLVCLAVYATTTIGDDVTVGADLIVTSGATIGTGSTADNFTILDENTLLIEGILEVDGAAYFDSTASVSGTLTLDGTWNTNTDFNEIMSIGADSSIMFPSCSGGWCWFVLHAPKQKSIIFEITADVGDDGSGGWEPELWLQVDYPASASSIWAWADNFYLKNRGGPIDIKPNDNGSDYIRFQTITGVPEILTVGNADFKINAGGSNNLLLQHDGGNVGIGTINPTALFEIQDDDSTDYLFAVTSSSAGDLFSVASTGYVGINGVNISAGVYANIPATCTEGDLYIRTDGGDNVANLYICDATDDWDPINFTN